MELLIKLAALSLCVSAVTALLKKSDEALSLLLLLAAVLVGCAMLLPALSGFLTMNFTGSSTYTSLSGVDREMKAPHAADGDNGTTCQ